VNSFEYYRRKIMLDQKDVCAALSVSQGAVSQWEIGKTRPRASLLPRVAELYGCTVDELLKDQPGEPPP
jgi:transcriptional regulator with XRE-family HTH domain